jgi:DNA-binding MarR family transcriptional regulator
MKEATQEIILRDIKPNIEKNLKKDIEWFCRCFGFMELRDKEKTASAIFREIVNVSKKGKGITSADIMEKLNISRGITVYYLNKLIKSGFVRKIGNTYELRMNNLEDTIEEIKKDAVRILENIKEIAKEIDESMGLMKRH